MALVLIALDQGTKCWVQEVFYESQRLNVLPFFDLTLVYNKGAAWSFLSEAGGWQRWLFTAISSIVSVVLVVWISRLQRSQVLLLWSLSLILAGAVGNLIDRILLGKVTDFLLFYYQGAHFPAFNVADSVITVGAVLLIVDMFVNGEGEPGSDH